jgi:uncharacterized protein YkwD
MALIGLWAACVPLSMPQAAAQSPAVFADVPFGHWAKQWIDALSSSGLTGGCAEGYYCPSSPVSRAQMAVFLLRGIHGSTYVPPPATGSMFSDVPVQHWAAAWVERLARAGIAGGCAQGRFCPDVLLTRDQMAVLLLRAKMGSGFNPPPASGAMFDDVTDDHWAAAWIEELARHGITGGCAADRYCPQAVVTRDQMAVFLVRTFDLPVAEPDFETVVVALVNAARAAHGLAPLAAQPQLMAAARGHSVDMAENDYFSHMGLDGSSFTDRIDEQGYFWLAAAENIAAGYPTPEDVVEGWMSSQGHRANILGATYRDIGVGFAFDSRSTYGWYWTTVFGRR